MCSGRSTHASRDIGPGGPVARVIGHPSGPACGRSPITRSTGHRTSRLQVCRAPPARVSVSGADRRPRVSITRRTKKCPALARGKFLEDVHRPWESLHTGAVCPARNAWSLRIRNRGRLVWPDFQMAPLSGRGSSPAGYENGSAGFVVGPGNGSVGRLHSGVRICPRGRFSRAVFPL